ncbi:hypothetical protein [Croceivirga sp. JEA036]|uniref:hypothetical protein n=1 Tax=Croceivirga sp. JEA036 TaxID=2721162 RepID=UPI0014397C36|nr:hypothetical protein [Croceivirga sp. JEA036]NJB36191.1 hypothetical protein [Croceivirga sp. JEA036]
MRVVKSFKPEAGMRHTLGSKSKSRNGWSFLILNTYALAVLVLAFLIQSPMQPFLVKGALLLLLISIFKTI